MRESVSWHHPPLNARCLNRHKYHPSIPWFPLQVTSKMGTHTHCSLQVYGDDQCVWVVLVGYSDAFEMGIAHQFSLPVMEWPPDILLEVINLVVVKGDGLLDVVPLDSSVWSMQGGLHHEEFITAGQWGRIGVGRWHQAWGGISVFECHFKFGLAGSSWRGERWNVEEVWVYVLHSLEVWEVGFKTGESSEFNRWSHDVGCG